MLYFQNPMTHLTKFGPWMHVDNFMTPKECADIVSQMDKNMNEAKVSESGVKNTGIRSAKTSALENIPKNEWIFQKLEQIITGCNSQVYQFDVLGFAEMIQLIRYDKDDHYDWHMDFANLHHSNRKLSVSVQLTSPDEYIGGELEFFKNGMAPISQGTLIMFPSFMYHKVHPILTGTRRALVGWVSGNPYR